ncbi:uncharacterized protein LOC142563267 [Dermacentor variabilis]|uniref:uncharacterized protein LOC142563267 n=1 Tax=Dermacentor variabilis TaxID=34621 RepID=UPI003F5C4359
MSKYTGPAHKGGVSVTLHSNWIEKPDSDEARRKKNQADVVLTFSTIDRKPILKVDATAVNEFTAKVQGAYEILQASEHCVVLRSPQHLRAPPEVHTDGSDVCLETVLAQCKPVFAEYVVA